MSNQLSLDELLSLAGKVSVWESKWDSESGDDWYHSSRSYRGHVEDISVVVTHYDYRTYYTSKWGSNRVDKKEGFMIYVSVGRVFSGEGRKVESLYEKIERDYNEKQKKEQERLKDLQEKENEARLLAALEKARKLAR
ncbi:MAG: hypothetical protein AAB394_04330 [Patescibacteria group bacterium]